MTRSHALPALFPRAAAVLLVAIALVLPAREAEANKGKLTVMNCGSEKVRLCVYDKTDVSALISNRSVDIEPGNFSTKVSCSTDGGCKVKVVKAGANCTNSNFESTIAEAKTLGEKSYRFNGKSFDEVSSDPAYFDDPARQVCPNAPKNKSIAVLNCTGGSLSLCVYVKGKLVMASSLRHQTETTLACGKPDGCTVTAGECTLDQSRNVAYDLSGSAYRVVRPPRDVTLGFERVSSDLDYFKDQTHRTCPAAK